MIEISVATGLHLIYDGTTSEAPREDRQPCQPVHYGRLWAPVPGATLRLQPGVGLIDALAVHGKMAAPVGECCKQFAERPVGQGVPGRGLQSQCP